MKMVLKVFSLIHFPQVHKVKVQDERKNEILSLEEVIIRYEQLCE